MKKFLNVLLILSLLFIIGCRPTGRGNKTYYVTITVQAVDAITNLAVEGAVTVIENGPAGKTSGDGTTVFNNILGNKEYTFITTADMYNINQKTVKIGTDNQTVITYLNKLKGTISGTVVDELEKPIEANIRLIELNKVTVTDPITGQFLFTDIPVMENAYSVSITKSGYNERIIENIQLSIKNLNASIGIIMLGNTPGIITGRVVDKYTRVISNVQVRVLETNQSTITDANGDYMIEVLPGSQYTVEFSHPDYGLVIKTNVQVRPGQTTVINVSLPVKPGSIFGIVRNNLDSPIPGVTVTVIGTSLSAITSIDGSFRVTNVPPGTYTLSFTHDLYNPSSASAVVKTNEETDIGIIVMPSKTGTIKGYLANSNCTVILIQNKLEQAFINPGYFQWDNIKAGNYIVKVTKENYQSVFVPFTLNSSEIKDLGSISCNKTQPGYPWGDETSSQTVSKSSYVNILNDDCYTKTDNFTINYTQTVQVIGSGDNNDNCNYFTRIYRSDGTIVWDSGTYKAAYKTWNVTLTPGTYYGFQGIDEFAFTSLEVQINYKTDIKIPQITLINPHYGSGSSSYSVMIKAVDIAPMTIQYALSNSWNDPGSSYYQNHINNTAVEITEPGIWYLHVKAIDDSGKVGYRCEGPFIIE